MTPTGSGRPPRVAAWVLTRLAPPSMREHLLGDLEQEFEARLGRGGARGPAARWYWWQAIRSVPHLLRERLAAGRRCGVWAPADLRYALRALRRAPTFSAVAIASLALGIGTNAIVFAFVHGALLAPLPVLEPDRLYMIHQTHAAMSSRWLSVPDFRSVRDGAGVFEDMAALTPESFIVQGAGDPQYIGSAEATTNYFELLGVVPVVGRTFGPEDEEAARAVISERMWVRSFGRDAAAVGSLIDIDGAPAEIVGVVPDNADLFGDTDLWIPLRTSIADWRESRGTDWIWAIGRLAPGVAPSVAEEGLEQLGLRLAAAFPETNVEQGFASQQLQEQLTGSLRTPLLVLMGAVLLVLLIVCVNLASLLLARGLARRREIATRIALGVGRGRLFRQLLAESLVLAVAGGALGVALAIHATPLIRNAVSTGAPGPVRDVAVDPAVLLFSATLCLGTTLLFGVAPAWGAARGDPGSVLAARSSGVDRRHVRARRGLVAGQMALALVLLVGASLLLRSFTTLYKLELGIRTEGVITARLPLVDADFPTNLERTRHYERLVEAVQDAPGIERAGMVNALPLRDNGPTFSFATSAPITVPEQDRLAGFRAVLGDYFGVLGIELVAGRSFTADERAGDRATVVVDRAFEAAFFPDGAIGERIELLDEMRTIVGVVSSTPDVSPRAVPRPKMYVPLTPDVRQTMTVVAAGSLAGTEALAVLQGALRSAAPRQTIQSALPMDALRDLALGQERLVLAVIGALGLVALLLAALGTYGVLAHLVSLRTREIGIRIALGASAGSVRRMVLASGAGMVGAGVLVGLVLAAAGARFLESLLFEVATLDPTSFGTAVLVLVAAALVASYLPARSATRTSVVEALRSD